MPIIIAWLINPANWLKLAAGLAAATLLAFLAVQSVELSAARAALAKAQAQTVVQHDQAIIASGQAAAAQSAAATEAARETADAAATQTHRENQNAIHAAPGAAQALNPALNRAGIAGLCRYGAEYAGSAECAQLRSGDPEKLQPAGSGGAATAR